MNIKNITLSALLLVSGTIFAQDTTKTAANLLKPQIKISYLDSIKSTFRRDAVASCVDSLWMKELTNLDLFDNLSADIKNINLDQKVDYELPTELLKARLKEMDAKSPFNIEWNQGLENIIKSFLKNRKKSYERLMAISEYYFPMFEESLARQNVPLEIKYLAIVESALNPKAVSRVGATGLWQFMYQTGKQYNLNIDSYVDERSDPQKASDAAAQYMSNMYKIFGDWDLVLASYNSGPGNVAKAIRRSGGQQNFWNIRKNLPKETQGYVPAFLATMYIYTYHKEHGIVPNRAIIKHFATDTIMIKQQITFKQLSDLLDVPVAQLQLLNPSYKMNVIPYYANVSHFLRLPAEKIAMFASNEDKVYAYVTHENEKRERPFIDRIRMNTSRDSTAIASADSTMTPRSRTKYHTVRRGDNLSEISSKYGVTVSDIKRWNRLKSNNAPLGRKLRIVVSENEAIAANVKKETKLAAAKEEKTVAASQREPKAAESTETPEFYTVQKGDNLSTIAKKYGVTIAELKDWNNMEDTNVLLDTKLKINRKAVEDLKEESAGMTPTYYVVQKGDNLGAIAKKNGVTVAQLQEWNNMTDSNVQLGSKLTIMKIESDDNQVAARVKKENAIRQSHYLVKKGDSLFTIAQKYPGVTVSDIKKWNGISGNNLRPGMKLKING
ncbi:MAG: lytic transglycosylase [Flavobacterium sp. BFFFF1]|uniref:LysM peptidoglycan-binding domain-containing protein n=1 Tax=Flavobacterium sp. BFFFF1 TaxID=2015557 RepID=UPI000BD73B64|nr:LysM peptidoglycan-binding domain-containing protein [Flavobacterium sp. BFFFF1]OYU79848.1 MAG: lytic transglycosylase [Flavobacterium sp. BFFFF1]